MGHEELVLLECIDHHSSVQSPACTESTLSDPAAASAASGGPRTRFTQPTVVRRAQLRLVQVSFGLA
eukprot:4651480-Amphidinium_carterae.2